MISKEWPMATDAESALLAKIDMEERDVPESLPSPRELANRKRIV